LIVAVGSLLAILIAFAAGVEAKPYYEGSALWREQIIRVLGTTLDDRYQPTGVVAELVVGLEQRPDHRGIEVTFEIEPGHFSQKTQGAVVLAIDRIARAARMNPDSWSVFLGFPSPGVTLYGDSLSAMVGLTVVALAKGDFVPLDRTMTGTVGHDGHIGVVSGIPLKIEAAHEQHISRVLIPQEFDRADPDWRTPFLMQVSPVGSVSDAYEALTDRPLRPVLQGR
jgi:predicted S18 family serine protease